jgi:two-component system, chemotaxis family, protein-glutamate methylesterase/glutaminase
VTIRVLIVDDTESMRDLMREHVIDSGMQVSGEAVDGLAAVSVARATQPDAVILDVEMPVLDGLSALPRVLSAAPHAKVVVFSSRPESATADAARSGGAVGVFYKGQHKSREVVEYVRDLFDHNGD